MLSNSGRDKVALFEVELATGTERMLVSDPLVDLKGTAFTAGKGGPIGAYAQPDFPKVEWIDAAFGREVDAAARTVLAAGMLAAAPAVTRPQSFSEDNRRAVLRSTGYFDSAELLWDRPSGKVTRLDPLKPDAAQLLSPQRPFSFETSDGRTVHG